MRALPRVPRCARSCAALRLSGAAAWPPSLVRKRNENKMPVAVLAPGKRLPAHGCRTSRAAHAMRCRLQLRRYLRPWRWRAAAARRCMQQCAGELPPLALLLARAAAHERKPELKLEATGTLALLLALHLTSGVDGSHAQNEDALLREQGPTEEAAPRQRAAGGPAPLPARAAQSLIRRRHIQFRQRQGALASGRGVPACVVLSLMRG